MHEERWKSLDQGKCFVGARLTESSMSALRLFTSIDGCRKLICLSRDGCERRDGGLRARGLVMGVMDSYSLGEFCRCKRFLLQNLRGRLHLSMSKRQLDRIDYIPRVAGFS